MNSHGREAVDAESIVERRRRGINSQRRNVGPAGLDFILRLASHGLTAMAIESRAFGAAVDVIGMTTGGFNSHVQSSNTEDIEGRGPTRRCGFLGLCPPPLSPTHSGSSF